MSGVTQVYKVKLQKIGFGSLACSCEIIVSLYDN